MQISYIGATIGSQYGAGSGQIWLDDVNCNGHESGIEQCVHPPWGQHNCDHTKDISITCCCGKSTYQQYNQGYCFLFIFLLG